MLDPTNKSALDEIKFYTGLQILPIQVALEPLSRLIESLHNEDDGSLEDFLGDGEVESISLMTMTTITMTLILTPTTHLLLSMLIKYSLMRLTEERLIFMLSRLSAYTLSHRWHIA